ncbi:hypothetical protein GGI17_003137 [Coemansia sp. S146]|nr:hypothetical protein GGI17_003137 [Coemansia sp. S146]
MYESTAVDIQTPEGRKRLRLIGGATDAILQSFAKPWGLSNPGYIIKDSWNYVLNDCRIPTLDEGQLLQGLQRNGEVRSHLPARSRKFRPHVVGAVHVQQHRGVDMDNNTDFVHGTLANLPLGAAHGNDDGRWGETHQRRHMRIVYYDVGKPITEAANMYDAIVAIADAMIFHNVVYEHAQVLHRNIAGSSISVKKDGDRPQPPRKFTLNVGRGERPTSANDDSDAVLDAPPVPKLPAIISPQEANKSMAGLADRRQHPAGGVDSMDYHLRRLRPSNNKGRRSSFMTTINNMPGR